MTPERTESTYDKYGPFRRLAGKPRSVLVIREMHEHNDKYRAGVDRYWSNERQRMLRHYAHVAKDRKFI